MGELLSPELGPGGRVVGGAPCTWTGLRTGDADEAGALPGAAGYPLGVGEVESVVGEVIHQVE